MVRSGQYCSQPPIIEYADGTILFAGPFDDFSEAHNYNEATNNTIARPTARLSGNSTSTIDHYCARIINGTEVPVIEMNSKASFFAEGGEIHTNKLYQGTVNRRVSATDGTTATDGYVENLASYKSARVNVYGLYDVDGNPMCSNINYGPAHLIQVDIAEPMCNYLTLSETIADIKALLALIKAGTVSSENQRALLPHLLGSGYADCKYLITQAMAFKTVQKTITSTKCPYMGGGDDYVLWENDPCCNWSLNEEQCCVASARDVPVEEASVSAQKMAKYCSADGTNAPMLTNAVMAAKAFIVDTENTKDPMSGCAAARTKQISNIKANDQVLESCINELWGEWTQQGQHHAKVSTQEVSTCAAVSVRGAKRKRRADELTFDHFFLVAVREGQRVHQRGLRRRRRQQRNEILQGLRAPGAHGQVPPLEPRAKGIRFPRSEAERRRHEGFRRRRRGEACRSRRTGEVHRSRRLEVPTYVEAVQGVLGP